MSVKISDFEPFIAVATFRSFRLAAEAAGVTPSAMSHSIRQLEERLKIRLFNRTTRSVSLTDAGHKLFESLSPLFNHAIDAIEAINDYRGTPIGTLRINAVRLGGRYRLAPIVAGFNKAYPDVRVEIIQDDNLVDIVSNEYDAGVRLSDIIEIYPAWPTYSLRRCGKPRIFSLACQTKAAPGSFGTLLHPVSLSWWAQLPVAIWSQ